jgi:hypothetical protein
LKHLSKEYSPFLYEPLLMTTTDTIEPHYHLIVCMNK